MDEINPGFGYCELIDKSLPFDHPFFLFTFEMRQAMADLAQAVSTGISSQQVREIVEMLDTLWEGLKDPDVRLPDAQRKSLNHEKEVWLDVKEKVMEGNTRASSLLSASTHMMRAVMYLKRLREDEEFRDVVSDYTVRYLHQLSLRTYREAMGHVLL
ncbi:hypothetical protein GCM10007108_14810 [Thermogymnomonas acidicola]|uniref:Uncharacterized protein n=1 Tax=Thermogymnomonas acidicola TaxID=399579 RepID=A0AA37FA05_9ARCH|nr:DUF1940 domain-containing protein [Thermogymnomonas acidicola]GGM77722.1 hypothetical protein GCM10007108_14810 [Thermogymnomonas acidicola]